MSLLTSYKVGGNQVCMTYCLKTFRKICNMEECSELRSIPMTARNRKAVPCGGLSHVRHILRRGWLVATHPAL